MIVSGGLGEKTVPAIHDMSQLDSIFIFCYKVAYHEQWSKGYLKVKGVFNKMDALCQAVQQSVEHHEPSPARTTTVIPKPSPVVHRSRTPEPPPSHSAHHDRVPSVDDHRRSASHPPEIKDEGFVRRKGDGGHGSSLASSVKPTTTGTPNSQEKLPSGLERLENNIIQTAERRIRESFLENNDISQPPSPNAAIIDRLQDTLVQTIEKHMPKKNNESIELNKMFAELKQVIIDSVVQEQSALLRDVIKQTVLDAFKQQQNSILEHLPPPSTTTTSTTGVTHHSKPTIMATNTEVKIAADRKKTRIDTDFRQQRDAVVANKRLRDVVQQWSSIKSMADLAGEIKKNGKNNLEWAWLLFCWIGQNIQYQPYCNNNAAETVFRTRQGVCRGFVSLYHECCSLLGIECSEISGYSKQAFLKPGEELKQSLHAWNSIILDQHAYLIDPTWGAGGRDYDKKLEDFYFLTSPEEFIYTHYANGYQLLDPEISKDEFLSLPVMKSTYYRLGLMLQSPKQGLNETNQNLFKIAIRTPAHVDLFADLKVGDIEYPRSLHTLCQRDKRKPDVYNCYIAPPLNGLYEVTIFAKTKDETMYVDAINMRLRVSDITDAFMFPIIYGTFTEQRCILIEPFQRLVHKKQRVLIHMIIPNANVIKIRNGDEYMVPYKDEYKNGVLKKEIEVQGDLQVCGRWDDKADSISIICIFNMI
ncbi:unnamed protein product [Rotaria sordida]|uniref:Transglutaminase-like domain-containing protein n=1 Tax=Rotaria sordida TaxID=392033 RepID=A0A814JWW0_9BILA|nr:unnamed protein product [Rotaria sordida]CAF1043057.1 unnamed protein product [Rotaria sordida]